MSNILCINLQSISSTGPFNSPFFSPHHFYFFSEYWWIDCRTAWVNVSFNLSVVWSNTRPQNLTALQNSGIRLLGCLQIPFPLMKSNSLNTIIVTNLTAKLSKVQKFWDIRKYGFNSQMAQNFWALQKRSIFLWADKKFPLFDEDV